MNAIETVVGRMTLSELARVVGKTVEELVGFALGAEAPRAGASRRRRRKEAVPAGLTRRELFSLSPALAPTVASTRASAAPAYGLRACPDTLEHNLRVFELVTVLRTEGPRRHEIGVLGDDDDHGCVVYDAYAHVRGVEFELSPVFEGIEVHGELSCAPANLDQVCRAFAPLARCGWTLVEQQEGDVTALVIEGLSGRFKLDDDLDALVPVVGAR